MMRVAVVGASPKPERHSNMAMHALIELGHEAIPVAPGRTEILGRKVYPTLAEVPGILDTVTMYLGARRQEAVIAEMIRKKPRRVIFNPGAENPHAYDSLRAAGIEVLEACTLVMLRTGQF
ncbi:MAG TPA: CoA-binding protein [Dissulfurispiraceae bacterium]|nr:CoA-binding protein [Dissulfurispiraceae bacterium]